MKSVKRMIDRALVFCSTRTAIATRLGVTPQRCNSSEEQSTRYTLCAVAKAVRIAHAPGRPAQPLRYMLTGRISGLLTLLACTGVVR